MAVDIGSLVERHTRAMGGAGAIESMEAVEIQFSVTEPAFSADGIYAADRQGRMRVDVYVDGARVFSEGHSGDEAWQLGKGASNSESASPTGERALLQGIDNQLLGLHELADRGYSLLSEADESVDGQLYHVIRVQSPYGTTLYRYVHPETWLIERSRERKALHPDVDPTETVIETVFRRFDRLENGVVKPVEETQVDLSTGQVLATTTLHSIDLQPLWPADRFEAP